MNRANVSPDTAILLWTVEFGSKNQILRLLKEKKADLNGTNENGDTVLHLIFRNENLVKRDVVSLLKIFLDRGLLDPNIGNKRGERILHAAVANRMKSVVEVLISYGADVDLSNEEGNSVAHLFVQNERNKFFKLLKLNERHGSEVEEMADESASFGEFLIEKGVEFGRENKEGKSALFLSIEYNLQHISLALLKHARGVNFVDRQNNSLLHLLLRKLSDVNFKVLDWYTDYTSRYATRIVKLLLEKGASAVASDNFGETPLRMAIEKRETSIIKMMVDHHLKNCDNNSATAVFLELSKGCAWWGELKTEYFLPVFDELIAKGADVNAKDKSGTTPAHHAFLWKNRPAADFLAGHGADFAASSEEGENLLHALARKDLRDKSDNSTLEALFELLKNRIYDLNAKNRDEETPLHLAAKSGNLAIVRKLIEHGAGVNCKNKYKETPLHRAVQCYQSGELVELLLKSGADVNSRDHRGRRPLLHAVDSACYQNPLVTTLLKWGAYVNIRNRNPSAFSTAIKDGCLSNAKEMLAYGADINDECVVGYLQKLDSHERSTIAAFVSDHWMKLMAAELPNSREYHAFEENRFYHAFQENQLYSRTNQQVYRACLKEVETLKATFIDGRSSIYAFLHMDFVSRLNYTVNENFKKIIDCHNLQRHFPMYKDVILGSYHETILWKSLLEPAKRAIFQLTNVQLPCECCKLIFTHLRNQDLVNVIECDEEV